MMIAEVGCKGICFGASQFEDFNSDEELEVEILWKRCLPLSSFKDSCKTTLPLMLNISIVILP
jgi:hypothetical protein